MTEPKFFNLAVVTATRAEYGLMSRLISVLEQHPHFHCQLLVTGSHLVDSLGFTVNEIRDSGHKITEEIPIMRPEGDASALENAHTVSQAVTQFAESFQRHETQAVIVLGDRYELMGICSAALLMKVPIIHLHGGETTEGAMDEAIRHAITKLSKWHFVAAEAYRTRVIQMGEAPERVFNVGALGLDVIRHTEFLTESELEADLDVSLDKPFWLITYHPETWQNGEGLVRLNALFKALESIPDVAIIWTAANSDAEGKAINNAVIDWVNETDLEVNVFASLGSRRYLSLLKLAQAVVGNSSSGIIEAPAFGVPTVNIGTRQQGRLKADSILDVEPTEEAIKKGLMKVRTGAFQTKAMQAVSLYGDGNSAERIVTQLQELLLRSRNIEPTKTFYDLEIAQK